MIKYKRFYQRIFSVPDGKYVNIALWLYRLSVDDASGVFGRLSSSKLSSYAPHFWFEY